MAKMHIDIPGLEVKVGRPRLTISGEAAEIPIEVKVISWPKLLWYVVRTEYDVKWYQWPYMLYVIAKVTLSGGGPMFKDTVAG